MESSGNELRLCFIKLIGEETDGNYRYEFIFTDEIDNVWGDGFNEKPACLINNLTVFDEYVSEVYVVRTNIKFSLIQDNCCFSISDAYDGCVAMAIEDLEGYDEYPEERGRLFFMFGEDLDEVREKLATCNILMESN
jgi:hypothetical protein